MKTATTRRAILAGAAALPALAIPVLAMSAGADPIFAAIEAHRAAFREFDATLKRKTELEDEHHDLVFSPTRNKTPEFAAARKAAGLDAMDRAEEETSAAESAARWHIATMLPTTAGGVVAVLAYARECSLKEDQFFVGVELANFHLSLEQAMRTIAGLPDLDPDVACRFIDDQWPEA